MIDTVQDEKGEDSDGPGHLGYMRKQLKHFTLTGSVTAVSVPCSRVDVDSLVAKDESTPFKEERRQCNLEEEFRLTQMSYISELRESIISKDLSTIIEEKQSYNNVSNLSGEHNTEDLG